MPDEPPQTRKSIDTVIPGAVCVVGAIFVPILAIPALVLGAIAAARQRVIAGTVIMVLGLAWGAYSYSQTLDEQAIGAPDPMEFVAPEVLDEPGTPAVDECIDPVSYEYIC